MSSRVLVAVVEGNLSGLRGRRAPVSKLPRFPEKLENMQWPHILAHDGGEGAKSNNPREGFGRRREEVGLDDGDAGGDAGDREVVASVAVVQSTKESEHVARELSSTWLTCCLRAESRPPVSGGQAQASRWRHLSMEVR